MAFPSETFVGQFSSELQPVADELRASGSQMTSYLGTQHQADGSHGDITADSIEIPQGSGYQFDTSDDERQGMYALVDSTTGAGLRVLQVVATSADLQAQAYLEASSNNRADLSALQLDTSTPLAALNLVKGGVDTHAVLTLTRFTVTGADIVTTLKYFERGRAVAVGEWSAVAYAAGNFTASAGTWTVDAGDQATYAYTLIGKTMTLAWIINSTDVSAGASLRIAIPGGFTAARSIHGSYRALDAGGTPVSALCLVTAAGTYVELYADQAANNFTITAGDNTFVSGEFTFEIQ